jgi:hypothetical protein
MQEALSSRLGRTVQLNLEQVQLAKNQPALPSPRPPSQDYLAAGVVRPLATTAQKTAPGAVLADLQQQIQGMLAPLLTPLEIDSPTLQSIARTNGVITLQVTGREPTATDISGWNVAAAALADQIASPVHITGSVLIPGESVIVQFRLHSGRALPRDLRRMRNLAKSWQSRPDISFELTASTASERNVTRQRIDFLKRELKDKVSEVLPPNSNVEPEQVEVSVVQTIDVAGEGLHVQK